MDATNDDNPRDFGELAGKILSHPKGGVEALINLSSGEATEWLEFKPALCQSNEISPEPKEKDGKLYLHVARAVIAMANSRGGVVLIGVSDSKPPEPVGLTCSDPKGILKNKGIGDFFNDVVEQAINPQNKKWKTGRATWVLKDNAALYQHYEPRTCLWKGKEVIAEDIDLDIGIHGYIPSEYIEEVEKIVVYRRLVTIDEISKLEEIKGEIRDRFGRLPQVVEDLFEYLTIKIIAQKNYIQSIKLEDGSYKIKFIENKINIEKIQELILSKKIRYLQKEGAIEMDNIRQFFEYYK